MVLPAELIEAIKQRATAQGLSITAYMSALVRADLGQPASPDLNQLAQQLYQLQTRVDELERLCRSEIEGSLSAVDLL
jgi:TolA-binding protein